MPDLRTAPPGASLELYVYYRSRPEDAAALGEAVRAMQRALASDWPGLLTRWLRRPELREGSVTWMEVYALPAGLSGEALEAVVAAIDAAAVRLSPWQVGDRKVERFLDATAAPPPDGGARALSDTVALPDGDGTHPGRG